MSSASVESRIAFTERIYAEGRAEEFGETILLSIARADDIHKPILIARVMMAHIRNEIDYGVAIRLVHIVNRSIYSDLRELRDFLGGVQKDPSVAESLFSVGLLSNHGFDGGGADQESNPGGFIFELNRFGSELAKLV